MQQWGYYCTCKEPVDFFLQPSSQLGWNILLSTVFKELGTRRQNSQTRKDWLNVWINLKIYKIKVGINFAKDHKKGGRFVRFCFYPILAILPVRNVMVVYAARNISKIFHPWYKLWFVLTYHIRGVTHDKDETHSHRRHCRITCSTISLQRRALWRGRLTIKDTI